jgi:hypothetical protein
MGRRDGRSGPTSRLSRVAEAGLHSQAPSRGRTSRLAGVGRHGSEAVEDLVQTQPLPFAREQSTTRPARCGAAAARADGGPRFGVGSASYGGRCLRSRPYGPRVFDGGKSRLRYGRVPCPGPCCRPSPPLTGLSGARSWPAPPAWEPEPLRPRRHRGEGAAVGRDDVPAGRRFGGSEETQPVSWI